MASLIRSSTLIGFSDVVTQLNGDPVEQLCRAHIDPRKLEDLDGVIALSAHINLLSQSARELNCEDFGLRMSKYQNLRVLGPLAVMAQGERTVDKALEKISQHMLFHCPDLIMRVESDAEPGFSHLSFELDAHIPNPRHFLECVLGVAHKVVGMLSGDAYATKRILLPYESPLPEDVYRKYFDAPISFHEQTCALVFSSDYLERKIDHCSEALRATMEQFVRNTIGNRAMGLTGQIKLLARALLPTQRCSLKVIAMQLGITPRTLQRRLAEGNLLFESLLDDVRRERADVYLADQRMPISQVAGLVGYADQSSFNRACRRWFCVTPLERRHRLTQEAGASLTFD